MMRRALSPLFKWGKFKKIWSLFFICLAMLNVTACDYINSKFYPDFKASATKTPVEKPPFARQNNPPKISIDKMRDIAETNTQDKGDFTINPVALKNESPTSQGFNTGQLFTDPVKTDEERFARIEARVQKISDTLNKMSPAITKLIGIESELDSLTFQLEELISKGKLDQLVIEKNEAKNIINNQITQPSALKTQKKIPAPAPHKQAKAPTPQPEQPIQIAPLGTLIHKIRLGDHPDKTRIVFETTEKLDYSVAVDNKEKIMTVTFQKGSIGTNPARIARQSNIIKSISQNTDGDGSIIAFELTQTAQKPKQFRIPPGAELSRHRIVIDLKR